MKRLLAVLAIAALAMIPAAQPAEAAKKEHVRIFLCHWSEEDQEFGLIQVDSHGATSHLKRHELDFVAQDGADTDCNAPVV